MSNSFRPIAEACNYPLSVDKKPAPVITQARVALGVRLAAARDKTQLNQLQVAQRFGLNKATVSAWETGRGVPDALRLQELAKLYGTTPNDLLYEQTAHVWPFTRLTPEQFALIPGPSREAAESVLFAALPLEEIPLVIHRESRKA